MNLMAGCPNINIVCDTDAKSTFHSISSIHIYSLQPNVLADLNVLTDIKREMLTTHGNEDPLEHGSKWGMIQNKNVKVCVPLPSRLGQWTEILCNIAAESSASTSYYTARAEEGNSSSQQACTPTTAVESR